MGPVTPGRVSNAGTDAVFDAFYADEYDRLVRLAHLLLGGRGDPESLAQETFLRVEPRFASLHSPKAYARQTLVNLCRRQQRRTARERIASEAELLAVAVSDDTRELLDVIDRLPFRQRAVVVLRYYEDLSEASIAEAIKCRRGHGQVDRPSSARELAEGARP